MHSIRYCLGILTWICSFSCTIRHPSTFPVWQQFNSISSFNNPGPTPPSRRHGFGSTTLTHETNKPGTVQPNKISFLFWTGKSIQRYLFLDKTMGQSFWTRITRDFVSGSDFSVKYGSESEQTTRISNYFLHFASNHSQSKDNDCASKKTIQCQFNWKELCL